MTNRMYKFNGTKKRITDSESVIEIVSQSLVIYVESSGGVPVVLYVGTRHLNVEPRIQL